MNFNITPTIILEAIWSVIWLLLIIDILRRRTNRFLLNFEQNQKIIWIVLMVLFQIVPIGIYLILFKNKGIHLQSIVKLLLILGQTIPSIAYFYLFKKHNDILHFLNRYKTTRGLHDFLTNGDVLSKIGVTLFIVIIYRALANVPLPGIDMKIYSQFFGKSTASEINYIFTIFTGGRLETPSLVGLGLAAYINASIMMQILPYAIPRLKELQKDGERGRQIINQITRYITLPLSLLYSVGYIYLISSRDLNNPNNDPSISGATGYKASYLISHALNSQWPTIQKVILMALVLTAGTIFLMWLSEIITEKGMGNGSSVIIMIGILSSLPILLNQDFSKVNFNDIVRQLVEGHFSVLNSPLTLALIAVIIGGILIIGGIIFINESIRKVSIQYARRVRGADTGRGSFLPIKFTLTGVLPVIFTYAILSMPQVLIPLLERVAVKDSGFFKYLESLKTSFLYAPTSGVVNRESLIYAIVYFVLVIGCGLFYAFIVLPPDETAENLQKSGAFIPGIRPGKSTQKHISGVLLRISFIGAIFLAIIAEIPILARDLVLSSSGQSLAVLSGIGGTSILILVSVLMDTVRQYKSLQATRSYEKYIL